MEFKVKMILKMEWTICCIRRNRNDLVCFITYVVFSTPCLWSCKFVWVPAVNANDYKSPVTSSSGSNAHHLFTFLPLCFVQQANLLASSCRMCVPHASFVLCSVSICRMEKQIPSRTKTALGSGVRLYTLPCSVFAKASFIRSSRKLWFFNQIWFQKDLNAFFRSFAIILFGVNFNTMFRIGFAITFRNCYQKKSFHMENWWGKSWYLCKRFGIQKNQV